MVIVFAEILRSVIATKLRGEIACINILAEICFVIILKEVLKSAMFRYSVDILIAVAALLISTIILYIIKVRIKE